MILPGLGEFSETPPPVFLLRLLVFLFLLQFVVQQRQCSAMHCRIVLPLSRSKLQDRSRYKKIVGRSTSTVEIFFLILSGRGRGGATAVVPIMIVLVGVVVTSLQHIALFCRFGGLRMPPRSGPGNWVTQPRKKKMGSGDKTLFVPFGGRSVGCRLVVSYASK